jgi:hypothetical protein
LTRYKIRLKKQELLALNIEIDFNGAKTKGQLQPITLAHGIGIVCAPKLKGKTKVQLEEELRNVGVELGSKNSKIWRHQKG